MTAYTFEEGETESQDHDKGGEMSKSSPVYGKRVERGSYHFEVAVKYVRREIRRMTDRDREIFFNAVAVMQRVPSAVGQQVYGKRYFSKDYFNRLHLYYGMYVRHVKTRS